MSRYGVQTLAQRAARAAFAASALSTEVKNAVLVQVAEGLKTQRHEIQRANARDVRAAQRKCLSPALIDRLILNEKRIDATAAAVLDVAKLPDPVGSVTENYVHGRLRIKRVRIPLGVICMIYESRPNVTVDAASLCFKAGNAVILRGGSEAYHSNRCLVGLMQAVLKRQGLSGGLISMVNDVSRRSLVALLQQDTFINLVIPRGGAGLMAFIAKHTRIPVIKHDKGVCGIFVDETAPVERAIAVVVNAKVQRPGVCNALETLYVHEKIAPDFLPPLCAALKAKGVEIRGDAQVKKLITFAKRATEKDWAEEYLDLILAIKVVKDTADAIKNIQKYSSRHTESILTENPDNAQRFVGTLNSSCVMVNTSTRFNDGGELGLGAEIGISTTRLHAFGPMGLKELTTTKFVVESDFAVRN